MEDQKFELRPLADHGNADIQDYLGRCYEQGRYLNQDEEKAVSSYLAAAKNADEQYNLGRCYEQGYGLERDEEKAAACYLAAARQNHAGGQYKLGRCHELGLGVKRDEKIAAALYLAAADKGYAEGQFRLGLCYARGFGVRQNEEAALIWFLTAAAQNHASANHNIGWCYQRGKGILKNEVQAVAWYRAAAKLGNRMSQATLGYFHQYGLGGLGVDLAKAIEWYAQGARHPDVMLAAYSQAFLGWCYEQGLGVLGDLNKALKLYAKSARYGHPIACWHLSRFYQQKEQSLAEFWKQRAQQSHHIFVLNAEFFALCYEHGWGVEANPGQAKIWQQQMKQQAEKTADPIIPQKVEKRAHSAVVSAGHVPVPIERLVKRRKVEVKTPEEKTNPEKWLAGVFVDNSMPPPAPASNMPIPPSTPAPVSSAPSLAAAVARRGVFPFPLSLPQQAQSGEASLASGVVPEPLHP